MEGELAATAKKVVEAVAILGIDLDFDFERGCVSALQVAADQKPLLEKTKYGSYLSEACFGKGKVAHLCFGCCYHLYASSVRF